MTPRRSSSQQERHRRIIRRTGAACAICGDPIDYDLPYLDPGEFVVDHIVSLAKGGADTLANKQASHRACNRLKSDKDYAPIVRRSGSLT